MLSNDASHIPSKIREGKSLPSVVPVWALPSAVAGWVSGSALLPCFAADQYLPCLVALEPAK